jgi:Ca-activated chloride channel family protein
LGFAIVLLLVEMLLPDTRRSSKFKVQSSTVATAATVLLLAVGSVAEAAQPPSPPRMIVQPKETEQDKAAMRERRLSEKAERENRKKIEDYERRLKKDPNDARVYFNKGTVEFENGDYEQAEQDLKRALNTPDLDLQSRAYYNLGNTLFRRGTQDEDVSKKKQAWEQATNLYTSALRLNTNDTDARYNLDLVGKKIAMLPQPPPQPQQSKSDNQKKDDQQKQDQQQQQQQQQQQDQQKKDEQKQQQQPKPDEAKQDEQQEQEQDSADASKSKEMTPQQARQLLDVQKAEEKPMIFAPLKTNRVERHFKNW